MLTCAARVYEVKTDVELSGTAVEAQLDRTNKARRLSVLAMPSLVSNYLPCNWKQRLILRPFLLQDVEGGIGLTNGVSCLFFLLSLAPDAPQKLLRHQR
jgi:hypothetical protein